MSTIKTKCEEDARRIAAEKDSCMSDLAKAQPFVDQARHHRPTTTLNVLHEGRQLCMHTRGCMCTWFKQVLSQRLSIATLIIAFASISRIPLPFEQEGIGDRG